MAGQVIRCGWCQSTTDLEFLPGGKIKCGCCGTVTQDEHIVDKPNDDLLESLKNQWYRISELTKDDPKQYDVATSKLKDLAVDYPKVATVWLELACAESKGLSALGDDAKAHLRIAQRADGAAENAFSGITNKLIAEHDQLVQAVKAFRTGRRTELTRYEESCRNLEQQIAQQKAQLDHCKTQVQIKQNDQIGFETRAGQTDEKVSTQKAIIKRLKGKKRIKVIIGWVLLLLFILLFVMTLLTSNLHWGWMFNEASLSKLLDINIIARISSALWRVPFLCSIPGVIGTGVSALAMFIVSIVLLSNGGIKRQIREAKDEMNTAVNEQNALTQERGVKASSLNQANENVRQVTAQLNTLESQLAAAKNALAEQMNVDYNGPERERYNQTRATLYNVIARFVQI